MKYTNQFVPKMGLLADVLMHAASDLLFFCVTFGISLVAFADCFYVMLGSNMGSYYSFKRAVISLVRALFGDFDVDEIDDNSPSATNSYIFLVYLFVAVFILLSMFFAILGDAQGVVIERAKQKAALKEKERKRRMALARELGQPLPPQNMAERVQ